MFSLATIATGTADTLLVSVLVVLVFGWLAPVLGAAATIGGAALSAYLASKGNKEAAEAGKPGGNWAETRFGIRGPENPFGDRGLPGTMSEGGRSEEASRYGEINFGANPYIGDARGQQGEARWQYQQALEAMRRRASGADSVVAQQGQIERDRAQRTFASQLATMGGQGYYSPAAARQSMLQSSGFQQNIAGQLAAASAQERQAAQDAYLKGIGGMREQDMALMARELEQERQRQAYIKAMQDAAQGWRSFGLQDKWHQQQGTLDWAKMLVSAPAGTPPPPPEGTPSPGAPSAVPSGQQQSWLPQAPAANYTKDPREPAWPP